MVLYGCWSLQLVGLWSWLARVVSRCVRCVCVFWCAVGYWWLWYCSVVSKGGALELLVSAVFGDCGMVSKGGALELLVSAVFGGCGMVSKGGALEPLVSAVFGSCGIIVWVLLDGALEPTGL